MSYWDQPHKPYTKFHPDLNEFMLGLVKALKEKNYDHAAVLINSGFGHTGLIVSAKDFGDGVSK
jgi:hypothetical protein